MHHLSATRILTAVKPARYELVGCIAAPGRQAHYCNHRPQTQAAAGPDLNTLNYARKPIRNYVLKNIRISCECESLQPVNTGAKRLQLPVTTLYMPSLQVGSRICPTARAGNFDLLLTGIERSLPEGRSREIPDNQ